MAPGRIAAAFLHRAAQAVLESRALSRVQTCIADSSRLRVMARSPAPPSRPRRAVGVDRGSRVPGLLVDPLQLLGVLADAEAVPERSTPGLGLKAALQRSELAVPASDRIGRGPWRGIRRSVEVERPPLAEAGQRQPEADVSPPARADGDPPVHRVDRKST